MDTGLLLVIGIALGLGFDLYAKAVCQGALLSRIDKAKLALGLLVCGVYQLIVLLVGYALTIWLRGSYLADKGEALNPLISMVIFVAFAIKMLKNAWKNEGIVESRHDGKYLIRIFCFHFFFGGYHWENSIRQKQFDPFTQDHAVFYKHTYVCP